MFLSSKNIFGGSIGLSLSLSLYRAKGINTVEFTNLQTCHTKHIDIVTINPSVAPPLWEPYPIDAMGTNLIINS